MDLPKITDSEKEVMKLLWKRSPQTANEIIEVLSIKMNWSEQTIKTFLNRLHKKSAIRFEKDSRSYLYYPLVTEEDYYQIENKCFLERVYDGAVGMLFSHFIREEMLTDDEIEELEQLLRKKKNESLNKKD
ncbi:MAG: BlaI/MecI/CopY family transcriptional regulator [Aminipila sp.]